MTLETWIAFTIASTIMLVIPGPTVLLIVSYALGQGWRAAAPMAIGTTLGDFTAITLSLAGVGALLATSATIFTVLKVAGALYLIWLGLRLWRAGGIAEAEPRTDRPPALRMMFHAWIVTALNPKSITFFVAFVPQFLDPAAPLLPQLAIIEMTFVALACTNAFTYAVVAARARRFVRNEGALRMFNRVGGSLLMGAGLLLIGSRIARN